MIILGLDPGLGTTGWGIIRKEGNRLSHIDNGEITTDAKMPLANRLVMIDEKLRVILDHFRPDQAAVEEVLFRTDRVNFPRVSKFGYSIYIVCLMSRKTPLSSNFP